MPQAFILKTRKRKPAKHSSYGCLGHLWASSAINGQGVVAVQVRCDSDELDADVLAVISPDEARAVAATWRRGRQPMNDCLTDLNLIDLDRHVDRSFTDVFELLDDVQIGGWTIGVKAEDGVLAADMLDAVADDADRIAALVQEFQRQGMTRSEAAVRFVRFHHAEPASPRVQ